MDTYRLTRLPGSYTKAQIRSLFSECDQHLIVDPISLAKSPYPNRSAEQVATISFSQVPSFAVPTPHSNAATPNSNVAGPPSAEPLDCLLATRLQILYLDKQAQFIRIDNKFEGLTPLNDLQNSEKAVDIVASTGLAGRAFGSWQHEGGTMWLRDHLPGDLPETRILIWGQTSKLNDSRSHLTTLDLRDTFLDDLVLLQQTTGNQLRPLILVGHSLGGIIIKAAFIKTLQDAEYSRLHAAIHGLVFIATPHEGMETSHWEDLWTGSPPQTLIQDLKPGSTLLKNLREGFPSMRMDIDILSCYERDETATSRKTEDGTVKRDGPPVLYISESASCTFHPREERIAINLDHSLVSKLSVGEGSPYHTILQHLDRIVRNARIIVNHRIRSNELIEAMDRVSNSLDRYIKGRKDSHVLMIVLKNEIVDISRTVIGTGTAFNDQSKRPFVAEDSTSNYLDKACDIFSDVQRLTADIPEIADVSQERSSSGSRQDSIKASGLEEFSNAVIPLLLSLKEKLDHHGQTTIPGVLETFMGSDAAKQLGLDFVAKKRHDLESSETELLKRSDGFLEEVEDRHEISKDLLIGRYRPAPGADTNEVIIEYRSYARELVQMANEGDLHKLEVGAQRLATQLKNAMPGSERSTAIGTAIHSTMSVLHCIAWKHDESQKRFVLIYEFPEQLKHRLRESPSPIHTLQNRLDEDAPEQPLDQLYFTAYHITRTVFNLHINGWLHKNVNPSNIVFVNEKTPRRYPVPILKGFEFSRAIEMKSERLQSEDDSNNLYRHPNRWGLPSENATFSQIHDLYAVGTILFELGRNKRINEVVGRGFKSLTIQETLVKDSRKKIPKYLGTAFTRCVERCLKGDFNGDEDKGDSVLPFAFRRLVVDELKRMAFACGALID